MVKILYEKRSDSKMVAVDLPLMDRNEIDKLRFSGKPIVKFEYPEENGFIILPDDCEPIAIRKTILRMFLHCIAPREKVSFLGTYLDDTAGDESGITLQNM